VGAAARIHAVFPALRAIAVLRNPRERTVSAFNDYVRMGIIRYEGAHRARTPAERAEVMASLIDEKVSRDRSEAGVPPTLGG